MTKNRSRTKSVPPHSRHEKSQSSGQSSRPRPHSWPYEEDEEEESPVRDHRLHKKPKERRQSNRYLEAEEDFD